MPLRHARSCLLALLCAAALLPASALAGDELLVPEWLGHPGVRLIVVDFYATWCKPCMEAMPRWRALQERYYKQGLRVVLVNTQDPDGGCRSVGFTPFQSVCDLDGRLSQQFSLQGKLPAAFLWSWQGNLLVRKGHIDEVEREIERYLRDAPRVLVQRSADVPAAVVDKVREKLSDDGKVLVVAAQDQAKALEDAKRAQQSARYDERQQCEAGREVPPNALLQLRKVAQGRDTFLNAALLDLESGCQLQSASAPWGEPREMAAQAVAALLSKLKLPSMAMPQGAVGEARKQVVTNKASKEAGKDVDLGGAADVVVAFACEPEAAVLVDGKMLCAKTPCKKELSQGPHQVEFQAADYLPDRQQVAISAGMRQVKGKLLADVGLLTVTSEPERLAVEINGKPYKTPAAAQRVVPGKAQSVKLVDPCYLGQEQRFAVAPGEDKHVALIGEKRMGGVKLRAEDGATGDAIEAEVLIDGVAVGRTPWKGKVWVCSKQAMVSRGAEKKAVALTVVEGQVQEAELVFGARGTVKAVARDSVVVKPETAPAVTRPAARVASPVASAWREPQARGPAKPRTAASGWITLGFGGATALVGGAVWWSANSDEAKLQAAVTPGTTMATYTYDGARAAASSIEGRYKVGVGLLGVGGVGLVVGAVLVATVDAPRIAVVPSLDGLAVVGRW